MSLRQIKYKSETHRMRQQGCVWDIWNMSVKSIKYGFNTYEIWVSDISNMSLKYIEFELEKYEIWVSCIKYQSGTYQIWVWVSSNMTLETYWMWVGDNNYEYETFQICI